MPDTHRPTVTPHDGHDRLVLAAAVDRDADAATQAAAAAQVASCAECAALVDELRMLVAQLGDLPGELPAPRDMRIAPETAARLRRGGAWRAILRPFGPGGLPGLRPLATALATLGLAGVLFTTIGFGLGGAASLPTVASPVGVGNGDARAGAAPLPTQIKGDTAAEAGSSAMPPQAFSSPGFAVANPSPGVSPAAGQAMDLAGPAGGGPGLLLVASLAALAAGLALFGLRIAAGRLR